jgi:hypothetical protein
MTDSKNDKEPAMLRLPERPVPDPDLDDAMLGPTGHPIILDDPGTPGLDFARLG